MAIFTIIRQLAWKKQLKTLINVKDFALKVVNGWELIQYLQAQPILGMLIIQQLDTTQSNEISDPACFICLST